MEADLTRPVATLVTLRKIGEFIDIDNNKILIVGRKRENVRTDSINFIAFKEDDIIGLHPSERISILAEARFHNNRFQLLLSLIHI